MSLANPTAQKLVTWAMVDSAGWTSSPWLIATWADFVYVAFAINA